MNKNIKTKTIQIETKLNGVLIKGELEFSSKDYGVRLIEPFKDSHSSHLQYAVPAKYVYKKSENPDCHEIKLYEKSKEILESMYLKKIKEEIKL
ncbi:hypothetical protein [Poseidonibacter ostreae]|uniref:Uncharacterized protein n=1 Tax=Poseidonibacter ostreae TaxID=2654171 RepID=A0A6L4WN89_9BACT|nr:hypothetical protein [Poseidonibacter ostreae]KAB7881944.1 hypothetical protein GA417_14050 [Poseidonibacter ostreae]KAB7884363.1 hypothetical protein GBG19_15855 [Poseidonibacter ostreae]KAB7886605.1 hypothetical protein GBG18_14535 [Poseidonibacter ostreae]